MKRRVPADKYRAFNEDEFNYDLLHRLTEQAPGAIFQLEVKPDGGMRFKFMSRGIEDIHPDLNPEMIKENPRLGFSSIHPDDLQQARTSMHIAHQNNSQWITEFRVVDKLGNTHWHSVNARPEIANDGTVTWFGIFQDVTESKAYTQVLEQILFDISHVIRRPASSIIGLSDMLKNEMDSGEEGNAKQLISMLNDAAEELDSFIHQLNEAYVNRHQSLQQRKRG